MSKQVYVLVEHIQNGELGYEGESVAIPISVFSQFEKSLEYLHSVVPSSLDITSNSEQLLIADVLDTISGKDCLACAVMGIVPFGEYYTPYVSHYSISIARLNPAD